MQPYRVRHCETGGFMVNLEQCAIIIRQICDATEPGKKMVQKLFYLMERKGLQLNLAYSIHFFWTI